MKHTLLVSLKAMVVLLSRLLPGIGGRFGFWLFTTPIGARQEPKNPQLIAITTDVMAEAQQATLNAAGGDLAVYRWRAFSGESTEAGRVYLVHGWQSRALFMTGLVQPLRAAGLEVIAFDLPAHGKSSGSRLFHTQAVAAITAVIERFGPAQGLVGHSFGGAMSALAAASNLPVGRLVLISAVESLPGVTKRFASTIGLSRGAQRDFEQRLSALSDMPFDEMRITQALAALDRPVLVVHDRGDRDVPFEDGLANAAAGDHVSLHATEGLGHRRILFSEDVTSRIAEFLNNETPTDPTPIARDRHQPELGSRADA